MPTSRYQKDMGAIIVGIINAVKIRDRVHISRKHTITRRMRQASRNKISIKEDMGRVSHRDTESLSPFSL